MQTTALVAIVTVSLLAAGAKSAEPAKEGASKAAASAAAGPAAKPAARAADSAAARAPAKATDDARKPPAKRTGPPPKGSKTKLDDNLCYQCHTNKDQWDEKDPEAMRRYFPEAMLKDDVHFKAGVTCHDCHGGNFDSEKVNTAHAAEDGFRKNKTFEEIEKSCAACHAKEDKDVRQGEHETVWRKDGFADDSAKSCLGCHGKTIHSMPPNADSRSPVALSNQVLLCGRCHAKGMETYEASPHGRGLAKSGLVVTAVCADCHGAHRIEKPDREASPLYRDRVDMTCGKCHRLIGARLAKSVHGRNPAAEKTVAAGKSATYAKAAVSERRKPLCMDCHNGHDPSPTESALSRLSSPSHCGTCHAELSSGYRLSMHGSLSELGYGPAARCSDCHGSHDVLPASNPESTLSAANRGAPCRKCHPDAVENFLDFDPHADHRTAQRSWLLHGVYLVLLTLLFTTFAVAGVHSLLWFVRGLIHVLKHGRPRAMVPGTIAYRRFGPFHRVAHTIMVLSFLGLALTGLPLKYHQYQWAHVLAQAFGGFQSTGSVHRLLGAVNIGCLVVYAVRMAAQFVAGSPSGGSRWRVVFGPDSPVPNLRDVKDSALMMRWFFGLGPKPTFERWAYWEKFDFWGACADIVIIGATGVMLWFPNLICSILPGEALNLAKVIHSTQALLATGFVFSAHFFATHIRPEKFPMDMSMLSGLVSAEELHEERPEYLERMRREGKLAALETIVPPREVFSLLSLSGFVALLAGLGLLVGILVAALGG
jgi:cytochrome b subunit of formate dehydrogenase